MPSSLRSRPQPTSGFDAAIERFESLAARDHDAIDPRCRSALLHHDGTTERVLVLFHGFTNCPAQFASLARAAHLAGVSVLVPRAKGHGRADGQPHALGRVSAQAIAQAIDESIDIASGIGARITVAGFSFGGVCAAWAARNRAEVSETLIIAPSFLPYGYPLWTTRLLPPASRLLPERYLWWDPIRRESGVGAPYGYRRLSRRGIGSVFELGLDAWHGPVRRTGSLERAILVLNEWDFAVSPVAARRAFDTAIAPLAEDSEIYRFPASLQYPHDLVDPMGANAAREHESRAVLLRLLDIEADRTDLGCNKS